MVLRSTLPAFGIQIISLRLLKSTLARFFDQSNFSSNKNSQLQQFQRQLIKSNSKSSLQLLKSNRSSKKNSYQQNLLSNQKHKLPPHKKWFLRSNFEHLFISTNVTKATNAKSNLKAKKIDDIDFDFDNITIDS